MPTWWDRLTGNKRWGSSSAIAEPTDAQAIAGFGFLGDATPTAELHDALFQWNDDIDYWLFKQIQAEVLGQSLTVTYNNYNSLKLAIDKRIATQKTYIDTADAALAAVNASQTTAINGKHPLLGFNPVQQGTGIGQLPNSIKFGYASNNRVKLTVDSTDFGDVWTERENTKSLATAGYQKLASGLIIQWATIFIIGPSGGGDWVFPVTFPNAVLNIQATKVGNIDSQVVSVIASSASGCSFDQSEGTSATIVYALAFGY